MLHARYFQHDNLYVKGEAPGQNQNYSFVVDTAGGVAVPVDSDFFVFIFSRAQEGLGMITYEQDFLTKAYGTPKKKT